MMKKIEKLTLGPPGGLIDLISKPLAVQLTQCHKNEFALTDLNRKVLYKFESRALAALLEMWDSRIESARIVEQICEAGSSPKSITELHLLLDNKDMVVIDEREQVYLKKQIFPEFGSGLSSPCGLWGIPPSHPLVYMLLTPRMVKEIEKRTMIEAQIIHLLRVLWADYHSHCDYCKKSQLEIEGEFISFKARNINQQMVEFDLNK